MLGHGSMDGNVNRSMSMNMSGNRELKRQMELLRTGISKDYRGMFREPEGVIRYPFVVPGSQCYAGTLWDWDSWLSDVALHQIAEDNQAPLDKILKYGQGCVRNFLSAADFSGFVPITMDAVPQSNPLMCRKGPEDNMHKPVLAQHAAFLTRRCGGDGEWIREDFPKLAAFINCYRSHFKHKDTGLYVWNNDFAVGVDNDPCIFFRPPKSCGSIYLNSLMYRELLAMDYLCQRLGLSELGQDYAEEARRLFAAVQEHCWDERDGFFYNVDLNLLPVSHKPGLHYGQPRSWDCLIQRIGVWSGFLALWAGIATEEQADRMVKEHALNPKTFCGEYGIRTLSKMEKMYNLRATNNPSNWLGPVWGVSNYMVFRGMAKYGYQAQAAELVEKTVRLFARDMERFGALHEYYVPESGEPVMNRGFQNWNYLVMNMMAWLEKGEAVEEF